MSVAYEMAKIAAITSVFGERCESLFLVNLDVDDSITR